MKNEMIQEAFKNLDLDNKKIVIGCSTGPDSMALFDMLLKIRNKYNLYLICAHVNHNVREQSKEEAFFIEKYCQENSVLFETMTIEKYGDDNFQNEARNIRYNFFEKVINKYEADYLMTAHHGDDLIETILMRITRGSNLNGYSGFKKVVDMDTYRIIRPLICFTKEQLKEYDEVNNVFYFIDVSNSKSKYTRNRYRKEILPFLKSEDPNVHKKFLKFSENLCEVDKFVKKETDKAIDFVIDKEKLNIKKFLNMDAFIQKEILYYLLKDFYQDDLILISDKHVDLLFDVIKSNKPNVLVSLPNEVVARKAYNYFTLERSVDEVISYEIEFNTYTELPNNHHIEKVDITNDFSNNVIRLNSKEISLPLIVRTRRFGDKIVVKGMQGTKKVKDIFIDNKIDIAKRDIWPVVVDSLGHIVWIPRLKKSKFDKKSNEKYDIIMKYS